MLTLESLWPLALLAPLPPIWWLGRHSSTNLGRRHIAAATALRALTFVLVLLTLMRPTWHATTRAISVVYALDVSSSVPPGFLQAGLEWIRNANREYAPASARYVVFAQHPILVSDLEEVPRVAVTTAPDAGRGALQQSATNLELALDAALLSLDPEQVDRIVLMSDGNATQGDLWRALPRLLAQRVRVYTLPALARARRDAWIESIEVPSGTRRDEPVAVTVRLMSMAHARAVLRLFGAGGELGRRSVQLSSGMQEIVFRTRLRQAGAVDVVAEVKAEGDTTPEGDQLTLTTWVAPRARVLYAEGNSNSVGYLRDALTREGIDVTLAPVADLPQHASALSDYQAVILSDVPRNALDDMRMSALENYVRDGGGGLIYVGGETTYGQSGYSGTVLERLLPVEFKAQEQRKDLALVVCLDRSYSMKGRSMELAKAATRAALAILEEQHQFGVIAFDSRPYETVPLQPVRSRHHAEDLIDRIQAGGQTNIYPALATALRWLEGTESQSRHVILLSDGDTAPGDFERLLRRMTAARISVSTVAVGPAADRELMSDIARWGKGRAYYADDPDTVPQIFVEDTLNASRSTLTEEPVRAVVKRPVEALRSIDFARAPMLRGFAATKARDDAEVLLESASGAPLLVRWQYGLGRSMVFASDAKNRWAADWLRWDGYGRFWGQVTRDVLRRETEESLRFQVTREGGEAHVRLDAVSDDGRWRTRLTPAVRVRLPTGAEQTLNLRQTSPGAYVGTVALGSTGSRPFSVGLVPGGGITREAALRTGLRRLYYSYPDEYRSGPPNVELLRALAEATGGKLAPQAAEVFDPGGDRGRTRQGLWPLFAAAALVAYLLDIAVRRAPWLRRWFDRT